MERRRRGLDLLRPRHQRQSAGAGPRHGRAAERRHADPADHAQAGRPAQAPEGAAGHVREDLAARCCRSCAPTSTGGTGGKADAPGLRVGGKTGTGEKYDPAIRAYSHDKQVSSFAAVFPTDGPVERRPLLRADPAGRAHGTGDSFGFSTGGWVAAPAAGRVIDRIAPFLGVQRRADVARRSPADAAAAATTRGGPVSVRLSKLVQRDLARRSR